MYRGSTLLSQKEKPLDFQFKDDIIRAPDFTGIYPQCAFNRRGAMSRKGRPRKKKVIQEQPRIDHFSPRGRPGRPDETVVALEEYEALRLSDHLGMHQGRAAAMMGISQQSFSRIVREARRKVADAIVNAKIIRIDGGDFVSKRSIAVTEKLRRRPPEPEAA